MPTTFRGVVYPAHSDAMGHMTIQYYVAAFDQAFWHLVSEYGYAPEWRTSRQEGWADVRHEIDYKQELKVGDLYQVESSVTRVGGSSLTTRHVMLANDGTPCAEMTMISVYFDLKLRTSKPIPDLIRGLATAGLGLTDPTYS
ncbi:acyl-CoA thioesterase [Pseudomonas putida]